MPIIFDEWQSFRCSVIPASAPAVQVRESKRAFYAGAASLFSSMIAILDPSSDEPTERDLLVMDSISKELQQFQRGIIAGSN
jgi:hypothetical protein